MQDSDKQKQTEQTCMFVLFMYQVQEHSNSFELGKCHFFRNVFKNNLDIHADLYVLRIAVDHVADDMDPTGIRQFDNYHHNGIAIGRPCSHRHSPGFKVRNNGKSGYFAFPADFRPFGQHRIAIRTHALGRESEFPAVFATLDQKFVPFAPFVKLPGTFGVKPGKWFLICCGHLNPPDKNFLEN